MQTSNSHNTSIRLLTADSLRIFRHLILFVFIFFISAGVVWEMQEMGLFNTAFEKYGCLFFLYFSS